MIGTTLNHYRVLRQIGSGGMGEIYEAEDTRLHRKVALKILPTAVASDPERRQRFEREAQAVAALNHPNIVTIYAVEEAPSAAAGQPGVPFLAMELVEGSTLGDLIPAGGLPLDRVLRFGGAIADAIVAAQQRGITHRDLKPANIMVTSAGQVKVLDFGLAKLREIEAGALSQSVTTLAPGELTGDGRILGTVAYMSPEQAEGKPVDSRSDIFSLGIILHQMATGDQPFKGDTPVSIISAILKDTPGSVTDLKPGLPSDLARIVKHCLAKDPERRYQTAMDLRNELDELKQTVDSGVTGPVGARPAARAPRLGPAAMGVLAIVLVVGAALGWMYVTRSRTAPSAAAPKAAPVSLESMKMSRLTSTGKATLAAISPDGKFVVHVVAEPNGQSLWIRQTATSSNIQIVPAADVRYQGITVGPDGTYAYYVTYAAGSGMASLFQIPVLGGMARRILDDIDSPPSFSPDGSRFVFVRGVTDPPGAAVMMANADGSAERQLAARKLPLNFIAVRPAWSPDGKTIALSGQTVSGTLPQQVVLVDADTGAERALGGDWYSLGSLVWAADGSALIASAVERGGTNRQLFRVAYPGGAVGRVTNDLANYDGVSLSADSRLLVTIQSEALAALWVMPASNPAGAKAITTGARRDDGRSGLAWTPDGRIVYGSSTDGRPQIWIMDADGGNQKPLTADQALNAYPVVCAGGRYIVYTSVREGVPQVWRMDIDGGSPRALTKEMPSFQAMCAPDGATVAYNALERGARQGVWRVAIEGGQPERVAEHQFSAQALSPDSTLAAGIAWDAERRRQSIGILDLSSPASVKLLPFSPRAMSWMPAGRVLGYVDRKDGVDNVWTVAYGGGAPKLLTRFADQFIFAFAWSRDGKQLAISRGTVSTDVVLLTATR